MIHAGVYRERVSPSFGGTREQPISFVAYDGEKPELRGSEVLSGHWSQEKHNTDHPAIFRCALSQLIAGEAAYDGNVDGRVYGGFHPFLRQFNPNLIARPVSGYVATLETRRHDNLESMKQDPMLMGELGKRVKLLDEEITRMTRGDNPEFPRTLGQLFADGAPLVEVISLRELEQFSGTWMVGAGGNELMLHLPAGVSHPDDLLLEASVRHTVFSPLTRGLGHIHLKGLTIEHAANFIPVWGKSGWPQVGALSTRGGHHWVIENCHIRFNKGIGLDCGSEGGASNLENPETGAPLKDHSTSKWEHVGYHLIQNNDVSDNGHCGIAGIGHHETRILKNRIERNNREGWTSPFWEFAGIKLHFCFDGLIEGNLIRDNEAHGIWLDNQWRGTRVTRNVIVNNMWSGINMELGRGPAMIDHNIIGLTRQGSGVYGHDCSGVTVAHNLLYANSGHGVWFSYATPRIKAEDGCWDHRILNNLILGNKEGAVGLPLPWGCGGNNECDGNLYSGAGEYLDEGSGSRMPQFHLTNHTHCGQLEQMTHGHEVQTEEVVKRLLVEALTLNPEMRSTKFTKRHETRGSCDFLSIHPMDECMVIQNSLIFVIFRVFRGFLFSFQG